MRIARAALVTALVAATLSGCSLGSRQAMADRVVGAADAALAAGSLRGSLVVRVEPVRTRRPAPPGAPRVVAISTPPLVLAADLRSDRTSVGPTAEAHALVFDGAVIYQRRGSVPAHIAAIGPAAASNLFVLAPAATTPAAVATPGAVVPAVAPDPTAPATTKVQGRPWLKLDLDQVERNTQERTASSLGIDPGRLLRLLRGTLTGSVRLVGTVDVGGRPAAHYRMNVSREKAMRGRSNDERILLEKAFRVNAVSADVAKAELWIGEDGRPRRFLVRLRQRLDGSTAVDLHVDLTLADLGGAVAVDPPAKREVATVGTFNQLVHAATGA